MNGHVTLLEPPVITPDRLAADINKSLVNDGLLPLGSYPSDKICYQEVNEVDFSDIQRRPTCDYLKMLHDLGEWYYDPCRPRFLLNVLHYRQVWSLKNFKSQVYKSDAFPSNGVRDEWLKTFERVTRSALKRLGTMERLDELIAKKGSLFNRLRKAWYELHPLFSSETPETLEILERFRDCSHLFESNLLKIEGRLGEA